MFHYLHFEFFTMDSLLIVIATVILVLTCFVITLLILMQRPAQPGMGAAIGGGDTIAESAFGTESSKILRKFSIYAIVLFFILCFGLYLGHILSNQEGKAAATDVLDIAVEEPVVPVEEEQNVETAVQEATTSLEQAKEEVSEVAPEVEAEAGKTVEAVEETVEQIVPQEGSTK